MYLTPSYGVWRTGDIEEEEYMKMESYGKTSLLGKRERKSMVFVRRFSGFALSPF
jgi:hypothetical protein